MTRHLVAATKKNIARALKRVGLQEGLVDKMVIGDIRVFC